MRLYILSYYAPSSKKNRKRKVEITVVECFQNKHNYCSFIPSISFTQIIFQFINNATIDFESQRQ